MADRSVRRRKKKEEDDEKPSEEETAVGKHLRFNLATKTSKIGGHKAEYFTGSKAVDFLLDSKWASGEKGTTILFTDRNSVVRYLNELLYKGMFYRALKVVKKSKKEKEDEKKDEKKEKKPDKKEKKDKTKEKEKEKKNEKGGSKDEKEDASGKKTKEGKRKVRLEPTDDQYFADGNDAYVWVYDPIKPMYYVYGALLVIGAIAVCLFPLWPHWMRIGTYYTSLGGAGLVGSVLVLAVFRLIIFCIVWTTTIGKIHFWLFPNLLADVGILESFQPVYICDCMSGEKKDENEENGDKDDQGKEDGSENSKKDNPEELKAIEEKDLNAGEKTEETISTNGTEKADNLTEEQEEEPEGSSKSSSSADNGQEGFEFIEQEEISEASQDQDPEGTS